MWDGFDNRKFPRIRLECEVVLKIEGQENTTIKGTTENVGAGGIALLSQSPVERFTQCEINLVLDSKSSETLQFTGKVMWVVPVSDVRGENKRYDLGIEFLEVEEEKRNKIRELVQKHPNLIIHKKAK